MSNELFYVIGNETELYDDYNEALIAAIPDVTHPTGLQAEIQMLELTYDDEMFDVACDAAGLKCEDDDELSVWVVAEFSSYSHGYVIHSAYDSEADAEAAFLQLITIRYADRVGVYVPKYTYTDSEAGLQSVSFEKLSELIAFIEDFGYYGDSDGVVSFGEDEILAYESRQDGLTFKAVNRI